MNKDLNVEAFAKAETSINSIRRLVNSWIPTNASSIAPAHSIKKPIALYETVAKTRASAIKISKAEKEKQQMEQTIIAMEEEEREMKSRSVKKRKHNDVLNVLLIH